jgi:RNA polymerase nonessential primary-like sigma factor
MKSTVSNAGITSSSNSPTRNPAHSKKPASASINDTPASRVDDDAVLPAQPEIAEHETQEATAVEEAPAVYYDRHESPDATTLYLNEIGYIPLLSAEQEVQLAREVMEGSRPSKNRMIESNLRLVVAIAKRFQNRGLCLLDLVEEGNLGLIRAVEKYNPELGYRFSTYATWWIKQSIDRALMNHAQTIRYPIHVVRDIHACVKAGEQLRELLGREPSLSEISAKTDKPLKEVKRLMALHTKCYSADQPMGEDSEYSVVDSIAAARGDEPEQRLTVQDIKGNVEVWLGRLSHRHRDVVARRYGLLGHQDGTLEQVGADVGITRERVRQLQIEALGKLRRMMERDGFKPEFLQDL